jgi:hypothetical protein
MLLNAITARTLTKQARAKGNVEREVDRILGLIEAYIESHRQYEGVFQIDTRVVEIGGVIDTLMWLGFEVRDLDETQTVTSPYGYVAKNISWT